MPPMEKSIQLPRRKYLLITAIIAAALSLTEIIDVVELPFESSIGSPHFASFLGNSIALVVSTGYYGLFGLMLLESASLPVPSEVVLPLAGYLVYMGKMSFGWALLVSTAAGVAGSLIDYYAALWLGRPLVYKFADKIRLKRSSVVKAEDWLNGKGSISVLLARFVPGLRSVISFPAGLLRMKVREFVAMTLVGAAGWSALLIFAGYSAGALWQTEAAQVTGAITTLLLYAVATFSLLYVAYYFVGRGRVS